MKDIKKILTKTAFIGLSSAMLLQMATPMVAFAKDVNVNNEPYSQTFKTGSFRDKTAIVNNEVISYSIDHKANKKGTIIYLHGATLSKNTMRPLAESMTDNYQNVVVDLSGHGASTGSPKQSVKEYADTVQELIANLQEKGEITDNVTLVGWSLGGAISLDLALREIPSIKNIVMVNSGSKFFVPQIPVEYFDVTAIVNSLFTSSTTDKQKELVLDIVEKSDVPAETCVLDFDVARVFDITEQLHKIKIPVLILAGSVDPLATTDNQVEMDNLIPNSTLKMYENRSHCLVMEEAGQLAQDIKSFLK